MKLAFSMRQIFSLGIALVLIVWVVTAADYNEQARIMPLIIGVPVMVLAIYQAFADFRAGAVVKPAASVQQNRLRLSRYRWRPGGAAG